MTHFTLSLGTTTVTMGATEHFEDGRKPFSPHYLCIYSWLSLPYFPRQEDSYVMFSHNFRLATSIKWGPKECAHCSLRCTHCVTTVCCCNTWKQFLNKFAHSRPQRWCKLLYINMQYDNIPHLETLETLNVILDLSQVRIISQ